ncbi:MAG: HAMP domain-containing protein, partial [Cytophagales bacterium]|nr:HAMP domain-containing protein [Cytophagales bacterium]
EEGLGKSGETYLVGADYRMRTDSRFIISEPRGYLQMIEAAGSASPLELDLMKYYGTTVLFQSVKTESAQKPWLAYPALSPKRLPGVEVLSSFCPLEVADVKWCIIAEIDAAEVFGAVDQAARNSVKWLLVVVLCSVAASVLLARSLYAPIRALASATQELGKGNMHIRVKHQSHDELGQLASYFNSSVKAIQEQQEVILAKNTLLDEQKNELATQAENLRQLNTEIARMNDGLDQQVKARTAELETQNRVLAEYAYFNSHRLRAPVAGIISLLEVLRLSTKEKERNAALDLLSQATRDLDQLVYEIQHIIRAREGRDPR